MLSGDGVIDLAVLLDFDDSEIVFAQSSYNVMSLGSGSSTDGDLDALNRQAPILLTVDGGLADELDLRGYPVSALRAAGDFLQFDATTGASSLGSLEGFLPTKQIPPSGPNEAGFAGPDASALFAMSSMLRGVDASNEAPVVLEAVPAGVPNTQGTPRLALLPLNTRGEATPTTSTHATSEESHLDRSWSFEVAEAQSSRPALSPGVTSPLRPATETESSEEAARKAPEIRVGSQAAVSSESFRRVALIDRVEEDIDDLDSVEATVPPAPRHDDRDDAFASWYGPVEAGGHVLTGTAFALLAAARIRQRLADSDATLEPPRRPSATRGGDCLERKPRCAPIGDRP